MSFDPEDYEVQQVLAKILENPAIDTDKILRALFSDRSLDDQKGIAIGIQKALNNLFAEDEFGLPRKQRRLEFCWKILKEADKSLRKKGGKYFSSGAKYHEDVINLFEGILKTKNIHVCFLEALELISKLP